MLRLVDTNENVKMYCKNEVNYFQIWYNTECVQFGQLQWQNSIGTLGHFEKIT